MKTAIIEELKRLDEPKKPDYQYLADLRSILKKHLFNVDAKIASYLSSHDYA